MAIVFCKHSIFNFRVEVFVFNPSVNQFGSLYTYVHKAGKLQCLLYLILFHSLRSSVYGYRRVLGSLMDFETSTTSVESILDKLDI